MWGRGNKRRTANIETLIGSGTEVFGDVKFKGGLHIQGAIRGNVIAENDGRSMVSLDQNGTIEGEVRVPYVVVNGVVIGDVHGVEHVQLSSKARVTGNVYYNLIEMAIGAEVNGKLVHMPDEQEASAMLNRADPLEAER